jgi:hypothetical protein
VAIAIVVAAIARAWRWSSSPDFSWIDASMYAQCMMPPRWADTYFYQFLPAHRGADFLKDVRILVNDYDGRPIDPATCGIDVMDGGDVLIVTRRKDALGTSEAGDSCRTATVRLAWLSS